MKPALFVGLAFQIRYQFKNHHLFNSNRLKKNPEILLVTKELQLKGIPFKIEKQLDSSILNEISYNYNILIPFLYLNELQKVKV